MFSTLVHSLYFVLFFCFTVLVFCYVCYILFAFESTLVLSLRFAKHRNGINLNSKPMWLHILIGDTFVPCLPTETNLRNKQALLLLLFITNVLWWVFLLLLFYFFFFLNPLVPCTELSLQGKVKYSSLCKRWPIRMSFLQQR